MTDRENIEINILNQRSAFTLCHTDEHLHTEKNNPHTTLKAHLKLNFNAHIVKHNAKKSSARGLAQDGMQWV